MVPPPDTNAEAEALRLKATAESKFKASNNAKSALKYAKRTHRLCPHLPNVFETVTYATGTATDGRSLSWNERLVVEVSAHARSVTLEVKCRNAPGMKDVGVVRIAVEDILGGAAAGSDEERERFLSYALRESLHASWQESRSGGYVCHCFIASVTFPLFLQVSGRELQWIILAFLRSTFLPFSRIQTRTSLHFPST
ncbi:hypothetical protein Fmac_032125 [Flemingia macrophylla]|uniref:C2 domain-containing protein n=1 Tax=Flemingia macrophylla TaxID=520843 RepID=A0ABD1L409_9FABA